MYSFSWWSRLKCAALPYVLLLLAFPAMACLLSMLLLRATLQVLPWIAQTVHVLELVSATHFPFSSGALFKRVQARLE